MAWEEQGAGVWRGLKYEPSMVHEQGRGNKGRLWEGRSMRRDNSTGAWEGPGRVQEPGMGYEPGRGQFDRGLWQACV